MDDRISDVGGPQRGADFMPDGLAFPATKKEILDHARRSHLPPDVLGKLEHIPDKQYGNVGELIRSTINE